MGTRNAGKRFPLWKHKGTGLWCKKIKGRHRYFGTDKDKALEQYERERKYWESGQTPPTIATNACTIRELANAFLTFKRERVDTGELSLRSWTEYHRACDRIISVFGSERAASDLRPEDFGRLRADAAKAYGPVALAKFVTLAKSLFKYAFANDMIERPVRYGNHFDKPPRRIMDLAKERKGKKLVTAADVWKLLNHADAQLKAMILLGLNCAYGQTDCAGLQRRDLDAEPGWLSVPRSKTGIARRAKLWPETIQALAEVAKVRPAPKDPADEDCVFLTAHGNRWVRFLDRGKEKRGLALDAVAHEFKKLAKKAGVKVPGGPYTFRHTARTIGDEVRDGPAIDRVMGHKDHTMGGRYRQEISDERIAAITDHIRTWFLKGKPKKSKKLPNNQSVEIAKSTPVAG